MNIFKNNFVLRINLKLKKLLIILTSFDKILICSLFNNIAAGTEHLKFFSKIENIKTIIDIGAHNGQFALISKYFFKKTKIYSFDPLNESKKKYTKILKKKNGYNFFHNAIGPKNIIAKINITKSNDSSSLLNTTKRLNKIFTNTEIIAEEKIKIKKLINCIKKKEIKKPSLLKLDVQGYELEALKGCKELLSCFDYIYVECSFVELYENQSLFPIIKKWLKKRKFIYKEKFNCLYDNSNKDKIIQADFFFKNLR